MKKFVTLSFALFSSASFASAQIAVAAASPTATPVAPVEAACIVVTGGEIERSSTDTAQAVTVLNEDE